MPKPPTSRSLTYVASLARCHTEKAIEVLFGIMTNPDASHLARMRAAKILLNRGRRPLLAIADIAGGPASPPCTDLPDSGNRFGASVRASPCASVRNGSKGRYMRAAMSPPLHPRRNAMRALGLTRLIRLTRPDLTHLWREPHPECVAIIRAHKCLDEAKAYPINKSRGLAHLLYPLFELPPV
jgi:hypothetical protein